MNILCIDNSFFYKKILEDLTVKRNYKYFLAKTLSEAINILLKENIQLVITGTVMKEESAFKLLVESTKKLSKKIPIIIFSADSPSKEVERILNKYDSVSFIPKNIDSINKLAELIEINREKMEIWDRAKHEKIVILDNDTTSFKIIKNGLNEIGNNNGCFCVNAKELLLNVDTSSFFVLNAEEDTRSIKDLIFTIKSKNPKATIITLHHSDSIETISSFVMSGSDDYLLKPFNSNLFISKIYTKIKNILLLEKIEYQNKQLRELLKYDGLTKLYNHKYIIEFLEELDKKNQNYIIGMLDLDFFKSVNDTYGHPVGDLVLKRLARKLEDLTDTNYMLGRYGGEEFIIVCQNVSLQNFLIKMEEIRKSIESQVYPYPNLKTTVSIGINEKEFNSSFVSVISKADELLYKAKHNGRNRIEVVF